MKFAPTLAFALTLASSAQAASPLTAVGAWSRPAVAGTNGVGYLTLANAGAADALVKVESAIASRVEMHSSSMTGGVMRMAREPRVAVPAGGRTVFGPGGHHLMLIGLKMTTKAGDVLPATLTFASGAKLKVAFKVGAGGGPPTPAH